MCIENRGIEVSCGYWVRKHEKSCFIIHISFSHKAFCFGAHPLNFGSNGKIAQTEKSLKIILHNVSYSSYFSMVFLSFRKGLIFLSNGLHVK